MARRPRIYVPGVAHYVIQRGNNREACFYDNHVHLLATPSNEISLGK